MIPGRLAPAPRQPACPATCRLSPALTVLCARPDGHPGHHRGTVPAWGWEAHTWHDPAPTPA